MQFERAFVAAGGVLSAGPDPSGYGRVIAGPGDWQDLQLLVQAGFTPVQAIHIASQDGAIALGRADTIGTLQTGKNADAILVLGDPSTNINDAQNVEIVFKDGVGYDSKKLFASVRGLVGRI
jgi:predicted amidohydrolase YtcJ